MSQPGIVTITDLDTSREAGRIVYWTIHGSSNLSLVCKALEGAIPASALPTAPTPAAALAEAVRKTAAGGQVFPRRLRGERGWALVEETADPDTKKLRHRVILEAKFGLSDLDLVTEGQQLLAAQVAEEHAQQLENITASRLGDWLVQLVTHGLAGVTLRPSGGFYFVPQGSVHTWRAVADALRPLGAETYEIPALRGDEAMSAISSALEREVQAEVEALTNDLANGLGARALKNREARLAELNGKLGRYELLLGANLDQARGQIMQVQASVATAALSALGEP